jgi:hypothetical protein
MDRYIKIEDENQEKEVKSIFSKPMTAKNVKVRPKSKKDIK